MLALLTLQDTCVLLGMLHKPGGTSRFALTLSYVASVHALVPLALSALHLDPVVGFFSVHKDASLGMSVVILVPECLLAGNWAAQRVSQRGVPGLPASPRSGS